MTPATEAREHFHNVIAAAMGPAWKAGDSGEPGADYALAINKPQWGPAWKAGDSSRCGGRGADHGAVAAMGTGLEGR